MSKSRGRDIEIDSNQILTDEGNGIVIMTALRDIVVFHTLKRRLHRCYCPRRAEGH